MHLTGNLAPFRPRSARGAEMLVGIALRCRARTPRAPAGLAAESPYA